MSEAYNEFVAARLAAGDDPNEIIGYVEDAIIPLAVKAGWALFGDGNWRRDTVCPVCGVWCALLCGHDQTPIPAAEYAARKQPTGATE